MFRVMELRDGRVVSTEGSERVAPPPPGMLRWVDLTSPDAAQLELLRERFDFHPLTIEDCGHLDQRPKLEEYRDHLFLVTQGFSARGDKVEELELHELHAFLGEHYLVTVHETPIAALEEAWQRLSREPKLLTRRRFHVLPRPRRHRRQQLPDPRPHRRRAGGARGSGS